LNKTNEMKTKYLSIEIKLEISTVN
jgi:hypothetical protein